MRPFAYQRAGEIAEAIPAGGQTGQGQTDAPVQFLAGGTTLVDLMKLDVLRPREVVDIAPLVALFGKIEARPDMLKLGALVKMAEAADHPAILRDYPVIAQSLQMAASAQLRNMATLGGNVLQRTRCAYFRDPSYVHCNKRAPGSGCSALSGVNRNFAVLGADDSCIAQYPGDFAVVLAALDAEVELAGPAGQRIIPFETLHRLAEGKPYIETTLQSGEVITGFCLAYEPWLRRSLFVKVRDRQSYEFAVASAAVALDLDGDIVRQARIGVGGLAYKPWRAHEAEALLTGMALSRASAEAAARAVFAKAVIHGENAFKPELGRRTLVRALMAAQALEV